MTPLEESNGQFSSLMDLIANSFPRGESKDLLPGIRAGFGMVAVPFMNQCLFTEPVADLPGLRLRIEAAMAYAEAAGVPWLLGLCHDWIPEGAAAVVAEYGFSSAMELVGMATDELLPARRELPALDYRRARGKAGADIIAEINQAAYGMPPEMAPLMSIPPMWEGDNYGIIGLFNGEPVTCSATFALDGRLYVAWVATMPDHQRKGYAEAVMRHSLKVAADATGLHRTVLHASPPGAPVYQGMGYRPVCRFTAYVLAPAPAA